MREACQQGRTYYYCAQVLYAELNVYTRTKGRPTRQFLQFFSKDASALMCGDTRGLNKTHCFFQVPLEGQ